MRARVHPNPPEASGADTDLFSSLVVKRTVSLVNHETGKSRQFTIIVGNPSSQSRRGAVIEGEVLHRTLDEAQGIFEELMGNGSVPAKP